MDGFGAGNYQTLLFSIFWVVIAIFLIVDLGVLNKHAKEVSTKSAFYQTIFWITISVIFGFLIWGYGGGEDPALEYFSAYLLEKALSMDNIFVMILIFKYFGVKPKFFHKILVWGILGALLFRGVFIFAGVYFVGQFHWILYIFGAFLIYTGIKMLFDQEDDDMNPEDNPVIRISRRVLNITKGDFDGRFIIWRRGRLLFTPLFLVILLIETSDLIFALDSIPAAFAVSQSQFVIYTSNIFAVLGLRAMFFLLSGIMNKFHHLQKGLSFILIFIGVKMLISYFDIHIPTYVSFAVIVASIGLSIVYSIFVPQKESSELEEGGAE